MTTSKLPPAHPTKKQEYTFTTSIYPPILLSPSNPKPTILYPTPSDPSPSTNDPIFTASMHIRHAVFVTEQLCSAEEEIDDDDGRSWGWVVTASERHANHYDHDGGGGGEGGEEEEEEEEGKAVGTIRLVPPPHIAHAHLTDPSASTPGGAGREFDYDHEPYVKITRVAVLAPFRGYGVSRLLMRTVEEWAARNKGVIDEMYSRFAAAQTKGEGKGWNGLIGLHAQAQVERMYAALGYETDESMGRWDEEGIEHVGMFKRVDIV